MLKPGSRLTGHDFQLAGRTSPLPLESSGGSSLASSTANGSAQWRQLDSSPPLPRRLPHVPLNRLNSLALCSPQLCECLPCHFGVSAVDISCVRPMSLLALPAHMVLPHSHYSTRLRHAQRLNELSRSGLPSTTASLKPTARTNPSLAPSTAGLPSSQLRCSTRTREKSPDEVDGKWG